jgi:hypothetical protein
VISYCWNGAIPCDLTQALYIPLGYPKLLLV